MENNLYSISKDEVLKKLETKEEGLSTQEVANRQKKFGPNSLPPAKTNSLFSIFFKQFQNPLIYVLILASIVVFLLGEITDSLIILFVLTFNSIVGTIQEGKAQNTLKALKQLAKTNTTVLRNGQEVVLPDEQLVPGDVVLLQEGQKIPADCRIIENFDLTVDESTITGESLPVHKTSKQLENKQSTAVADRINMVYLGTFVSSGRAKAVVTATGRDTELGKIALSTESIDTEIPLKKSVELLTKQIIIVVGAISLILFFLGLTRGHSVKEMFATVVSLSVSAIPEGLPIVLTLVLATGVWRMSKRNALIKKLDAVEALGQTTVIAVDKTGTITQNKLMVTSLYSGDKLYTISGNGYEPVGEIKLDEKIIDKHNLPSDVQLAVSIAGSGTAAKVMQNDNNWKISGDPTEAAMLVMSMKFKSKINTDQDENKPVKEIPFDYKKKFRVSVYHKNNSHQMIVVGAPENVLALCSISEIEEQKVNEMIHQLSGQGLRIIAFALKESRDLPDTQKLASLKFGGLLGMKDVLHPEIAETVKKVHLAGLSVVMITGDHQVTAEAIAREAGIFRDGDGVLTGKDLEVLSIEDLARKLDNVSVFARVTPEHKQKIIEAYQKRGDIVAMTGDGVNDAPSLVAADLGLAMGIAGTEVAKEASDIVLLDDNFKSIVAAIEEGRSIYVTIKKVIAYLFATSVGEILVIALSLVLDLPLPVTAAQIIWLNLVTDGFLDVSLAMEPKEDNLLTNWNGSSKNLIDKVMLTRILIFAVTMAGGTLLLLGLADISDPIRFSSLALTVMAIFQWFNAWNSRSHDRSVFGRDILSNKYLIASTTTVFLLQLAALNQPLMQKILNTQPLSLNEWIACFVVASSALWVEEFRKLITHKYR